MTSLSRRRSSTWGVDAYNATQLGANPAAIAALTPTVQSQFTVTPVPEPSSAALMLGAGVMMLAGRRRKVKP